MAWVNLLPRSAIRSDGRYGRYAKANRNEWAQHYSKSCNDEQPRILGFWDMLKDETSNEYLSARAANADLGSGSHSAANYTPNSCPHREGGSLGTSPLCAPSNLNLAML